MAVVLIYNRKIKSWHSRYGLKPLEALSKGTVNWYKYCSKIGRRKYLKMSRQKSKVFEAKHPGNRKFRVFKATILKGKNVSPQLQINFRSLIETKNSTGLVKVYKHLTPQELYNKMKGV